MTEVVDADEINEPLRCRALLPTTEFPLLHSQSYATLPPEFVITATASRWTKRCANLSQPNADHQDEDDQAPHAEADDFARDGRRGRSAWWTRCRIGDPLELSHSLDSHHTKNPLPAAEKPLIDSMKRL